MELGLLYLRSSSHRPAPLGPFLRSRKTLHLRLPLRLKIPEGKPSKQELTGASSLHFSSCWNMSAIGLYTDGETELQRQEGCLRSHLWPQHTFCLGCAHSPGTFSFQLLSFIQTLPQGLCNSTIPAVLHIASNSGSREMPAS